MVLVMKEQCVDNESYIEISEPIETSLNMKLKQVRLPTNTYPFFVKIVFLYSYKLVEDIIQFHENSYKFRCSI